VFCKPTDASRLPFYGSLSVVDLTHSLFESSQGFLTTVAPFRVRVLFPLEKIFIQPHDASRLPVFTFTLVDLTRSLF
jgi:hypothetical protein